MNETDCLFCKILAGTAAADVIYQDNRCVVIRDINPQAPTHLLVIPREHMEHPVVAHLVTTLGDPVFTSYLAEQPGYDIRETGKVQWDSL